MTEGGGEEERRGGGEERKREREVTNLIVPECHVMPQLLAFNRIFVGTLFQFPLCFFSIWFSYFL